MIACFLVLFQFLTIALSINDFEPNNPCSSACITNFDSSNEDACSVGCQTAELLLSHPIPGTNCKSQCQTRYKDASIAKSCEFGCEAFKSRSDEWGTVDSSHSNNANEKESSGDDNRVLITRVHILRNFVPGEDSLFGSINPIEYLKKILQLVNSRDANSDLGSFDNDHVRLAVSSDDLHNEKYTFTSKVRYFFNQVAYRPFIPLSLLFISTLLLIFVLIMHSCKARRINHNRMLIDASNMKLPPYEYPTVTEKCEKPPLNV